MIVADLPDDILLLGTILPCNLTTCRCIRSLAHTHYFREYLFLHSLTSFEHTISFLQANPQICENTTRLKLQGEICEIGHWYRYSATTPLNDATVAHILPPLPKVEHLDLRIPIYPPLPRRPHPRLHTPFSRTVSSPATFSSAAGRRTSATPLRLSLARSASFPSSPPSGSVTS